MLNALVILVTLQALGAVIGAFMAVWSEVAYVRAMADGVISNAENAHLVHLGRGLRFGLGLLLLASLGLVIDAYARELGVQPALTASYWILIALSLVIIYISWALARKKVSFALGSAAAFTAWWFLAYLTLGLLPGLTFGAAFALYVVATAIFYGLLSYVHLLVAPPSPTQSS